MKTNVEKFNCLYESLYPTMENKEVEKKNETEDPKVKDDKLVDFDRDVVHAKNGKIETFKVLDNMISWK